MASENFHSLETWLFQPSTADSLFSETSMSRETDTLTRALQLQICSTNTTASFPKPNGVVPVTTRSGTSSPETDVSVAADPFRRNSTSVTLPPTGRISKRKSRASKKTPTTFINADPANFRQMVQQITGIRCPVAAGTSTILRPEPQRPNGGSNVVGSAALGALLPTLDTSALLLNQDDPLQTGPIRFETVSQNPIVDFLAFPTSFPTLESWRVM